MTWSSNDSNAGSVAPSGAPPQPQSVVVRGPGGQPVVTYVLLGMCVLVYLGQLATPLSNGWDWLSLWGAKINELLVAGQLWRFFTPMFLHGSPQHLLFNMYALYSIGRMIEPSYGRWRFLLLYVLGGFAGNVLSFVMTPAPSSGASTAIFGLLAAEGVFWYQNRRLFGDKAQRVLSNIVLIAAVNLFLGLSPMIDNWGHIGGLIGGLLFAWFAGPRLRVDGLYPNFVLADERDLRQVGTAALGVGALFALIAALVMIFMRL